jgi:hypothetical protein
VVGSASGPQRKQGCRVGNSRRGDVKESWQSQEWKEDRKEEGQKSRAPLAEPWPRPCPKPRPSLLLLEEEPVGFGTTVG